MAGWYDDIGASAHIKDEYQYRVRGKSTGVLESVEFWQTDWDAIYSGKVSSGERARNKVVSYDLRSYDGAMALLRGIHQYSYSTREVRLEKGKEKVHFAAHQGVMLPETVDNTKAELRLAVRAAQTILTAQGLGWMVGVRPDQEKYYLRDMPYEYKSLLERAKKGERAVEDKLVSRMAQDRKAAFSALERVQGIYWMGQNVHTLSSAVEALRRKMGFRPRLDYTELTRLADGLSKRMESQEKKIVDSRLAYIKRERQPKAVALLP